MGRMPPCPAVCSNENPLPREADFYIGAHAAIAQFALLTRDGARYRSYSRKIDLCSDETPA
jgi:predicted nucleic acid-binding protein